MRKQQAILPALMFFALLSQVAVAQTQPVANSDAQTGLDGIISVSPAHGGPSRQGIPDSAPLSNIPFLVKKETITVAEFTTDDHGGFRVSLPPGHYTISRKDPKPKLGGCGPFEIEVVAGRWGSVQWECDSGLR